MYGKGVLLVTIFWFLKQIGADTYNKIAEILKNQAIPAQLRHSIGSGNHGNSLISTWRILIERKQTN